MLWDWGEAQPILAWRKGGLEIGGWPPLQSSHLALHRRVGKRALHSKQYLHVGQESPVPCHVQKPNMVHFDQHTDRRFALTEVKSACVQSHQAPSMH